MRKIKIALVQMDIAEGEPEQNRKKALKFIDEAAGRGADLAVLPETWTTSYPDDLEAVADRDGYPTLPMISRAAQQHNINIIAGSITDIRGGAVYNTMYAVDRQGSIIGSYDKVHLFGLMGETGYFKPGRKLSCFEVDGILFGAEICYDLRFPEISRALALKGAKVLVIPAEWPYPRLHHWRVLNMARAIENQLFVVAVNRVGKTAKYEFFGHSMAIDPMGEILVEGSDEEELLMCEIDVSKADEFRKKLPVYSDRMPEVYES